MKKKIIIGLTVFSLIFLVAGFYMLTAKERSCAKLDNLVRLHRIEILRGHLLIHIKGAQSDLQRFDEEDTPPTDTFGAHINVMNSILESCFKCHHAAQVTGKIRHLKQQIGRFQTTATRAVTARGSADGTHAEQAAVRIGAQLIAEVDELTTMTSRKLDERTDKAMQDIRQTDHLLYGLLAVVPFVAAGFAALFIGGFTHPVNELLVATRRLRSGDMDYRIGRLQDEFGEVAASFNDMAESPHTHCLRMQWAEQLVVLGELAGGLAHEIKNPLAGIKASMEVLDADPAITADNREIVRKVIDQTRRIESLLKNLLNFARPPKPQCVPVDVNSVLDSTEGLVQQHPRFKSQGSGAIDIMKQYDPLLPRTMADPLQLQQIFTNLLLNAADAMPQGGWISLETSLSDTKDYIIIKITDTGEGIAPDIFEKIFQPFFTTKATGTGLGLSITRRLLEQLGGGICVKNEPGAGVTFVVTLPVLPVSLEKE